MNRAVPLISKYGLSMDDNERYARLIQPFYLHMMRNNALQYGSELLPAVAEAGREATVADVVSLLSDPWRATVMGAWLALFHDDKLVNDAVLHALEASDGSLTSPPLAIAAVLLVGSDALPSLDAYAAKDTAHQMGACGFAAAAIEHLGGHTTACDPNDGDRTNFAEMLALGGRLRAER